MRLEIEMPNTCKEFPKVMAMKSCMGAARKLYEAVVKDAVEVHGMLSSEVFLMDPDRANDCGYGKSWRVVWEAGPYEWGVVLSLNSMATADWTAEPYHSFDVGFHSEHGR